MSNFLKKISNLLLTGEIFDDRIQHALTKQHKNVEKHYMERYRSGHNEAVLKTVCPQGRVGSNPTLSVCKIQNKNFLKKVKKVLDNIKDTRYNITCR